MEILRCKMRAQFLGMSGYDFSRPIHVKRLAYIIALFVLLINNIILLTVFLLKCFFNMLCESL